MRDLFFKLFEMSHFNTGIQITPFSPAHWCYILLIGGTITGLYFGFRRKETAAKIRLLRALAFCLALSYFSDFFVHEFVYGGLNTDKLPFHICTVLCPLILVAQFHHKGDRIAEPVMLLSVLAPLMYLGYPASVGTGEPWCYQAVQTMFYHSCLLAWGVLRLTLGVTKPHIRRCGSSAVLLGGITLWAKLGCVLMEHNWFFLESDALGLGLVENGVIPSWALMIVNPVAFFLAVLALYGLYHLCLYAGPQHIPQKLEATKTHV